MDKKTQLLPAAGFCSYWQGKSSSLAGRKRGWDTLQPRKGKDLGLLASYGDEGEFTQQHTSLPLQLSPPHSPQVVPCLTRPGISPGQWDNLRLLLLPTICSDREKHRGSVRPLDKALPRHAQLLALGNQTTLRLSPQPRMLWGQRRQKGREME